MGDDAENVGQNLKITLLPRKIIFPKLEVIQILENYLQKAKILKSVAQLVGSNFTDVR